MQKNNKNLVGKIAELNKSISDLDDKLKFDQSEWTKENNGLKIDLKITTESKQKLEED